MKASTIAFVFFVAILLAGPAVNAADRPNILWISCEDISSHLGCYGVKHAITPNLDKLAARGIRYTHAFTTCPVCATNRSSIITGMYPTSIGTQHMRCTATLPDHIKCFPHYLRKAGYYCTNNAKTDYNFPLPRGVWDANGGRAHWRGRKPGQPFFHVRNFTNTHESRNWPRGAAHQKQTPDLKPSERQDPGKLELPPYYPDMPEVRRDWANYFENITQLDYNVAKLLKQLADDRLADDTIVMYWSDHGVGLPRGKRWLYDSGTRVPVIVYIPERFRVGEQGKPGTVTDELVSFIDLAPTVLNLCGVKVPEHMQGRAFLGKDLTPEREYVVSVRDRMDERYDMIRTIRTKKYRYTRNYMPWKPYFQWLNYAERNQTMKALRRLHAEGKLNDVQKLFMAERKPVEELYDCEADPHEVKNLAQKLSDEHKKLLEGFRTSLSNWHVETRDTGFLPEAILDVKGKNRGSRWAILQGEDGAARVERLRKVAPADGLCKMDAIDKRLPMLLKGLEDENPWVRLAAATALDELGDKAKPAIPALKKALAENRKKSKAFQYTARVVERALQKLTGKKAEGI